MKEKLSYIFVGLILGIVLSFLYINYLTFGNDSAEREREAIKYAQKVIEKEYYQENSPLEFPAISTTEIIRTDIGTYVVQFYVKFLEGRWVKNDIGIGDLRKKNGANFLVELNYDNNSWKVIETKLIDY